MGFFGLFGGKEKGAGAPPMDKEMAKPEGEAEEMNQAGTEEMAEEEKEEEEVAPEEEK